MSSDQASPPPVGHSRLSPSSRSAVSQVRDLGAHVEHSAHCADLCWPFWSGSSDLVRHLVPAGILIIVEVVFVVVTTRQFHIHRRSDSLPHAIDSQVNQAFHTLAPPVPAGFTSQI
jgi:hypothetical protein